jgi:Rhodopirellula transposase DDE domain
LLWTSKSVRNLDAELRAQGYAAHFTTVTALLRSLGYSLQSNRKAWREPSIPTATRSFASSTSASRRQSPLTQCCTEDERASSRVAGEIFRCVACRDHRLPTLEMPPGSLRSARG